MHSGLVICWWSGGYYTSVCVARNPYLRPLGFFCFARCRTFRVDQRRPYRSASYHRKAGISDLTTSATLFKPPHHGGGDLGELALSRTLQHGCLSARNTA